MVRDIDLYSVRPFKPKIKANQEITVYTLGSKDFDVNPTPDKIILRDLNGRAKVAEGIENDDIVNVLQLREYVADKLTSLYKNAGSIYFSDLSSYLTSEYVNYVFTILDDFVTTDEFIDGSNIDVLAGSTVAVIERNGRLWFDLLGTAYGHVDLKTDQVIGGHKIFEKTIEIEAIDDNEAISFNLHPVNGYGVTYGQTGLIIKGYENSGLTGEAYSLQYPMKSGTFALTIDVPSNLQNGEGAGSLQQKGTTAAYDNQATFGQYNDNKADTLFEVGNGTSDENRSNAFEVYKDGRTKVYGAPTEDEDVVRKADITSGEVLPPVATNTGKGVMAGNSNAAFILQDGKPQARPLTPGEYSKAAVTAFVAKGTLEANKSTYVKEGIVGNTQTLTDTEKADACEWLGAVPKLTGVPSGYGVMGTKYQSNTIKYWNMFPRITDRDWIPQYDEYENISTSTPVLEKDCTNKKYVDDAVANAGGKLYRHSVDISMDQGMLSIAFDCYTSSDVKMTSGIDFYNNVGSLSFITCYVADNRNLQYGFGFGNITCDNAGYFYGYITMLDENTGAFIKRINLAEYATNGYTVLSTNVRQI